MTEARLSKKGIGGGVTFTPDAARRTINAVGRIEQLTDPLRTTSRPELVPVRHRLGTIVSLGPGGEEDYDDERYWVQRAFIGNTANDPNERVNVTDYATDDPGFGIRTVTNLSELADRTHNLSVGTSVLMTNLASQGEQRVRMWVMNVGGGGGTTLRYCILRDVLSDFHLRVAGVRLTEDPQVIEVDDEESLVRTEAGIPGDWYRPLIWRGAPSMLTPFIYLTTIDGFKVALQKVKFPLVDPPNPVQFPPGGCYLLPRGG